MAIPEFYLRRMSAIGQRIILVESQNPGIVRFCSNFRTIPSAAIRLNNLGFHKRLLQSPQQFVYDSVLRYQQAIETLLPFTLLVRFSEGQDRFDCWNGCGQYAGWQGLLQMSDFSSGGKQSLVLVADIGAFSEQMVDLLDPIEPRDTTHPTA